MGTLLLPTSGAWLVTLTSWSLDDGWLLGAIALFAASLALGALGGRALRRAREWAEGLDFGADAPDELLALVRDRRSSVLNWTAAAAGAGAFVLMVWKP